MSLPPTLIASPALTFRLPSFVNFVPRRAQRDRRIHAVAAGLHPLPAITADAGSIGSGIPAIALGAESTAQPDAVSLVVRMVRNVAHGQRTRRQADLACIDRFLIAADHRALQVGIAVDDELEAAGAGANAALLLHARVITAQLAVTEIAADADAHAEGAAHAQALFFAVEGGRILQAFDVQVAADFCDHLFAAGDSTLDIGIPAAFDGELLAGSDVRVQLRVPLPSSLPLPTLALAVKPIDLPLLPKDAPIPADALMLLVSVCWLSWSWAATRLTSLSALSLMLPSAVRSLPMMLTLPSAPA